jgi:hypothetical protein
MEKNKGVSVIGKARAWCGTNPHFAGVTQNLANGFIESEARVQLLAKALQTCRIALERHRGYSLLEAALTEVDIALAEAGLNKEPA